MDTERNPHAWVMVYSQGGYSPMFEQEVYVIGYVKGDRYSCIPQDKHGIRLGLPYISDNLDDIRKQADKAFM